MAIWCVVGAWETNTRCIYSPLVMALSTPLPVVWKYQIRRYKLVVYHRDYATVVLGF